MFFEGTCTFVDDFGSEDDGIDPWNNISIVHRIFKIIGEKRIPLEFLSQSFRQIWGINN